MTDKPQTLDEDTVVAVAALLVAILIQFATPFLLYCCAFCMKTCKTYVEVKQERRRRTNLEREVDRCYLEVETAAISQSDEELAKCVQQYYEAVEQRDEAMKVKRRKGFYRNVTLVRLISLFAYISFYVWVAGFIGCEMSQCSKYGLSWKYLRIFGFVMLGITPIIVLIESAFSHELDYIFNILEDQSAWSFIQDMHTMVPEITFTVECYHYENNMDSTDTTSGTRSSSTRERVVTFKQDYPFTYGCCIDVSEQELPPLDKRRLTRIKVDPHIILGDSQTKQHFEEEEERVKNINMHRDEEISVSITEEIPGLDERFSAYSDPADKSWWIRPRYFWLASALFMSWPYRWVFRAMTPKLHYVLAKKIYKRRKPPNEDSKEIVNDILRRHGRELPGEHLESVIE